MTTRIIQRYSGSAIRPPISPIDFGLFADGKSHPLSSLYPSLKAAQSDYSFATTLNHEADWAACKAASNYAFGADGNEHGVNVHLNRTIYLPAGRYLFGNDTWRIRNLASGLIEGEGKLSTRLSGAVTVLAFDGIWYTTIRNISFAATANSAGAALEIDGNVPGQPYTTRGVQSITLQDLLIDGGGSDYALTMCRQGSNNAQGSECAFINLHLQNAAQACYYQKGFNALANTLVGGNVQNYQKNGILVDSGTLGIFNMGFQSTTGYKQIDNNGWDINVGASGAGEGVFVYGCRTESLRFLKNGGAVAVDVRSCIGRAAIPSAWFAGTTYGYGTNQGKVINVHVDGTLMVATTEGVSGGTEPVWPAVGGTVADNTVVWTRVANEYLNASGNSRVDRRTVFGDAGVVTAPWDGKTVSTTASVTVGDEDTVFVDCTGGVRTVTLPDDDNRDISIIRRDTSANALNVFASVGFETGSTTYAIPGGAFAARTFRRGRDPAGVTRWFVKGTR